MNTTNWIALIVGSYGAIIATITIIWNILRERRNVTVRIGYAIGTGLLVGQEMLAIEIVNSGRRPIHIQEVGFLRNDGFKLINPRQNHDLWLKDGDGTNCYVPKHEIDEMVTGAKAENKQIIGAYIRDSTNIYYKGKIRRHAMWFR
jgi:hypothetical protein